MTVAHDTGGRVALTTHLMMAEAERRGFRCEVLLDYPGCIVRVSREGAGFVFRHWPGFYAQTTRRDLRPLVDKLTQKEHLRAVGLPVPRLRMTTLDEVYAQRDRRGPWPLVVKPRIGCSGWHVRCDIRDQPTLEEAVETVVRAGEAPLVEDHVEGRHYRLVCIDGVFRGAVRRRAPFVEGNGTHTIERLVVERNAEPGRRPPDDPMALAHPLVIDDLHLARQGLSAASVPGAGAPVTVNPGILSTVGADFVDVTAEVHPDTVSRCETFARAHGLRVAGFDVITPDVSRSCLEVGAVNEVNVRNVHLGVVEHCTVGVRQPISRHLWNGLPLDHVAHPDHPSY